ncbi:hypothetical protein K402DRAFT_394854 [Aulographum hederae CBS 113979]|uniref:Uncharacterized protein n=1 Tax=Aulographum hederae CBS 113979 TaxID=1176131 RepID=A0A6G1GW22_9PEZI|nr:hypothetical protein K402DRAFT_394854 [Aulographum hederae CBS 113979]
MPAQGGPPADFSDRIASFSNQFASSTTESQQESTSPSSSQATSTGSEDVNQTSPSPSPTVAVSTNSAGSVVVSTGTLPTKTDVPPGQTVVKGPSGLTTVPTASASAAAESGFNSNQDSQDSEGSENPPSGGHSFAGPKIAAILGPVAVAIVLASVIAFFCIRRRRRRQRLHQAHASQEMKMHSPGPIGNEANSTSGPYFAHPSTAQPFLAPHSPQPSSSAARAASATSGQGSGSSGSEPSPVMLNTIIPNMGSGYLTGMDTSDAVSLHQASTHTSGPTRPTTASSGPQETQYPGFAYDYENPTGDEPPPPYRPRSVPSLHSRAGSDGFEGVDTAGGDLGMAGTTYLMAAGGGRGVAAGSRSGGARETDGLRSPFDDPDDSDDEDRVSRSDGASAYAGRGWGHGTPRASVDDDARSEVSALTVTTYRDAEEAPRGRRL